MPGLPVPTFSLRVSQQELDHLGTRRPDDGHSGYKNVYKTAHGTGWRVRLRIGGTLRSLQGVYPSPREAAKALVLFNRGRFGPDWLAVVRPGYVPYPW